MCIEYIPYANHATVYQMCFHFSKNRTIEIFRISLKLYKHVLYNVFLIWLWDFCRCLSPLLLVMLLLLFLNVATISFPFWALFASLFIICNGIFQSCVSRFGGHFFNDFFVLPIHHPIIALGNTKN